MRKTALACLVAGLGLIQAGVVAAAGPGWDRGLGLGGTAARLDASAPGLSAEGYGSQLSLSSPWLKLPSGTIGQQLSVSRYNHDGINLTTTELGPRYFTDVAPGLALGIGPGLGYTRADADLGKTADLWAVQIGADLDYHQGPLFMGLDTRYRWTEDQAMGADARAADNWLTTLKLGVSF